MSEADPTPPSHVLTREPFARACHAVNAWRGRCMDALARAEEGVTETLIMLSQVERSGPTVRLHHLVGQRFGALATAIAADGPFAAEGKAAASALAAFRKHEDLRILLCHGVGSITLDMRGRWTFVLRVVALRGGQVARNAQVFDEVEAGILAADLSAASRRLCSQLGNLRARFSASDPPRGGPR